MRLYFPIGKVLAKGCEISIELTLAYEGYYTQLHGEIPVSPYTAAKRKVLNGWKGVYTAAIEAVRPGSTTDDVCQAILKAQKSKGYMPSAEGHSVGLGGGFHFPGDDDIVIEPGMTIVLHAPAITEDGPRAGFSGTFLVTKAGTEALNKVIVDALSNPAFLSP